MSINEKQELDGKMTYSELREIIFNDYKETKGIQLSSISINYLKEKLKGNQSTPPFFIIDNEWGETRFDISVEDIQNILKSYFAKKDYELIDVHFHDMVEFTYQMNLQNKEETQECAKPEIPETAPSSQNSSQDELVQMAREERKFTILQKERAMTDAQKAKNRAAIMAGVCILGAATATHFNGQDIHLVLQHELNALYSWDTLGQYIRDLGPLTTLLSIGAGGFIVKYFKNAKKLNHATDEFIDFDNVIHEQEYEKDNVYVKSRRHFNTK